MGITKAASFICFVPGSIHNYLSASWILWYCNIPRYYSFWIQIGDRGLTGHGYSTRQSWKGMGSRVVMPEGELRVSWASVAESDLSIMKASRVACGLKFLLNLSTLLNIWEDIRFCSVWCVAENQAHYFQELQGDLAFQWKAEWCGVT